MNNVNKYSNQFFDELEVFEDTSRGHLYKTFLRQSVLEFLKDETKKNAFAVYESFFDSYRITLDGNRNPFIDLLDALRSYEEHAAILIDKQRDHFIHSVNVFILGLCIYTQNTSFRSAFIDKNLDKSEYPYSYDTKHEEFFYRWGIASLFHDIGYPVEIIGKQINKYMDFITGVDDKVIVKPHLEFENFEELNSIVELVNKRDFIKAYFEKYDSCVYIDLLKPIDLLAHKLHTSLNLDLKEVKAGLDEFVNIMAKNGFIDHGFFSAIIVLKWYGFLIQCCKFKPEYFYFPVLDSASAILLHNYYKNVIMKPPFNRGYLSPHDHPIAYLLILCDELQEWNRKAFGIVDKKRFRADEMSLMITENHLDLTYLGKKGVFPEQFSLEKEELLNQMLDIKAIFGKGLSVGWETIDRLKALSGDLKRDVTIVPRPLLENLEKLAIAIHELFNKKQLERHPNEPLAYPNFSDLPDTLKYSNLRQARSILNILDLMGWETHPINSEDDLITEIPENTVEKLAFFEHGEWVKERLGSGWMYGANRDVDKKTSPYLIPYEDLPEEVKDLDRDIIRNLPELLAKIDVGIYVIKT